MHFVYISALMDILIIAYKESKSLKRVYHITLPEKTITNSPFHSLSLFQIAKFSLPSLRETNKSRKRVDENFTKGTAGCKRSA